MSITVIIVCVLFLLIAFLVYFGFRENVADWGNPLTNLIDGWLRIYIRYFHGFIYQPLPVSDKGPALIAGNHISGIDPFLILAACRRPIRFMIAREEYERFGFTWLFKLAGCIPVERTGRVEKAFRATLKALNDGELVGLFPQGGIHRPDQPRLRLKSGVIKLAKLSNVPITPVVVDGMKAKGHTLTPFLIPSECRLYVAPVLDCMDDPDKDCLSKLHELLKLHLE